MHIVQITPGTGNFHCGVCLRDRALARAFRAQGHEVTMLPMYLPHVTDDNEGQPEAPIFYGGINVYLQQKFPLFRRTPAWFDRWFDAPALLRLAAKGAGMTSARDLGELTISTLRGEEGRQAKEVAKLVAWLRTQPRADVISLASVLLVGLVRRLRAELGVPVTCALQGEDAFLDSLIEPYRQQAWELVAERSREVARFVAPSRYYAELMGRRLRLPAAQVAVVPNGIAAEDFTPAAATSPTIGYLARMHPSKGLHTLVDAYIKLSRELKGVRLHVAGAQTNSDLRYVGEQQRKLADAGLSDLVTWQPNLDRAQKAEFLRGLTVFSVPSTYGESFGLYLLEAWAAGLPVVQPRHAMFPELLAETGAGVLCEPDDAGSLAGKLAELLREPVRARELGARGRQAVVERYTASAMARGVAEVFAAAGQAAVSTKS
jgi:glycosyltransferase involved in cell wall biosynthesis